MAVTVKEAIRKGQLEVNLPSVVIYILTTSYCFYLYKFESFPLWLFVASLFFAIIPTWIYWSYAIVKWRLWAFKNVKNVHELKDKAVMYYLIWEDNLIYNKTEVWTKFQKREWKTILKKFEQQDYYKDDRTIPFETVIKYSPKSFAFVLVLSLLFITVASLNFYYSKYLFGIIFIGVAAYTFVDNYNKYRIPFYLIINEEGIQTKHTDFILWNDVESAIIEREGTGNNTKYFLKIIYIFDENLFYEKLLIQDFSISKNKLDTILRIYKQRYQKNNERTNYKQIKTPNS